MNNKQIPTNQCGWVFFNKYPQMKQHKVMVPHGVSTLDTNFLKDKDIFFLQ